MLIINADDWGRSQDETDAAYECWRRGRVTSVSAMVFMEDSERAAELAVAQGVDAGLHLNLSEEFTGRGSTEDLRRRHRRVCSYLKGRRLAQVVFNPFLQQDFAVCFEAQIKEFERLYGMPPSHLDGHHHMHLSANMLWSRLVPSGMRMRRNFSFAKGEKSLANRAYRAAVDGWLARRYRLPEFFFCILEMSRRQRIDSIIKLAQMHDVELMTHPLIAEERALLLSDAMEVRLRQVRMGSYSEL
jgi:predicted glycoside hydrolase/deacetylase ChbG (UPF0249 family)